MTREGKSWINNVAHGAQCKSFSPSDEMINLAINSSIALGMNYSGVDIMLGKDGYCNRSKQYSGMERIQSVHSNLNFAEEMVNEFFENL